MRVTCAGVLELLRKDLKDVIILELERSKRQQELNKQELGDDHSSSLLSSWREEGKKPRNTKIRPCRITSTDPATSSTL